jgi:predicted transcriptional regulator
MITIWHSFHGMADNTGCKNKLNNLSSSITNLISIKSRNCRGSRKDRSQSISSILDLLNGHPLRQSNIIQKSGIAYDQAKEYMTLLTRCDLLSYNEQDLTYKTTAKGLHYLSLHNRMSELLPLDQINAD